MVKNNTQYVFYKIFAIKSTMQNGKAIGAAKYITLETVQIVKLLVFLKQIYPNFRQ